MPGYSVFVLCGVPENDAQFKRVCAEQGRVLIVALGCAFAEHDRSMILVEHAIVEAFARN